MKLIITSEQASLIASVLRGKALSADLDGLLEEMEAAIRKDHEIQELRRHPCVLGGRYGQDLIEGKVELRLCPGCPDLVAWRKEHGDSCNRCGARFRDLPDMFLEQYELIKKGLDESWVAIQAARQINLNYPMPQDSLGHCKTCAERTSKNHGIVCSADCFFKLVGRPRPEGRKWDGFFTLNPHFKGSKVLYLGAFPYGDRGLGEQCRAGEWYMWDTQGRRDFYVYFASGEVWNRDYLCAAVGTSDIDFREARKVFEAGGGVDESWRVAANAVEKW